MWLFIVAVIAVSLLLKIYNVLMAGRCKSPVCLVGKTVLISGGNSGLGFQAGLALAGRGCRLIIADIENSEESKKKIIQETGNTNIVTKQFDLGSLSSVRKLAKDIKDTEERLDILINNAAIVGIGHVYSEDGLPKGLQVNHFGGFLLTHLLIDLLKKSAPSRIIFASSAAAFCTNLTVKDLKLPMQEPTVTSEFLIYAKCKLCNIITTLEFARRLKGTGVTSNTLHPGVIDTPLLKKAAYSQAKVQLRKQLIHFLVGLPLRLFSKDEEEGAQTMIHLALAKELEKETGGYYVDCQQHRLPTLAKDQNLSSEIWKASEDYVKLAPEERLQF